MMYTVKALAKMSGVSVRTLHWYDTIGLLKPSSHGLTNGYRYYTSVQLMRLQQILFFKELGFSLHTIQNLLSQNDFDHLQALQAHRKVLEEHIARKKRLIATIDDTIEHLKGNLDMEPQALYQGFDHPKQKEYESDLIAHYGAPAQDRIQTSKKRTASWGKQQWAGVKDEFDAIHQALAQAITQGLAPESQAVQTIMARHCHMVAQFYDVSYAVYGGLAELYAQHPEFRASLESYHPEMINFLGHAMRLYAHQNLR